MDERGTAREGRANLQGSEPGFELPPLTPGYHRLTVQAGQTRAEVLGDRRAPALLAPAPLHGGGGLRLGHGRAALRPALEPPISASAPTRMPARPPARPPCAARRS
ncbi:hypothetical protein ACU4GR_04740 [Methylobacterium oryzae CBMB20]